MGLPRAEPRPQGEKDRKANLGSVGEDSSNKGAARVQWASGAWVEQSEGYVPRLYRRVHLVCVVLLPLLAVPTGQGFILLQMPFLICKMVINKRLAE